MLSKLFEFANDNPVRISHSLGPTDSVYVVCSTKVCRCGLAAMNF